MPDDPANRLIAEKSPYLLAHAHQPVDWYPWGDEAFEAARSCQEVTKSWGEQPLCPPIILHG
jgi:uncharacterized protein YyaL (SSP411 family)